MKKILVAFLSVFCISFISNGQGKCEDLYKAIIKNDKSKVHLLLIKDSTDANCVMSSGPWMKVSMLITAVNNENIDIVKQLIEHKADVNWKDGFNTTALMYAASIGNKDIVILLLDNGADINATDGQGNTVFSAAKESKNKEVIQLLEDKLKDKK